MVDRDLAGPRPGQEFAAGIGQVKAICPPVVRIGATLDPSGGTNPIDESDHVSFGNEEPLGQLLLSDGFAVPERREDVELGQRQAMSRKG